ncbi:MAG: hypothetical protein ACI9MC_000221 [Kiritimatiellia bacterium]|jgi:hypothetical protein
MSDRKRSKRFDTWRNWRFVSADLLTEIPESIVQFEQHFQAFAGSGLLLDGVTTIRTGEKSETQVRALWTLANMRTELDMDCILFDALNGRFRSLIPSA